MVHGRRAGVRHMKLAEGAYLAADWVFKVAIVCLFLFSAVLASMLWLRV